MESRLGHPAQWSTTRSHPRLKVLNTIARGALAGSQQWSRVAITLRKRALQLAGCRPVTATSLGQPRARRRGLLAVNSAATCHLPPSNANGVRSTFALEKVWPSLASGGDVDRWSASSWRSAKLGRRWRPLGALAMPVRRTCSGGSQRNDRRVMVAARMSRSLNRPRFVNAGLSWLAGYPRPGLPGGACGLAYGEVPCGLSATRASAPA
jgi:hypothetical protein